jgi:2-polyprenyl-3-methyl-5-hydroxy-6-metoxy-1,4-benzoquinol methylase
MSSARCRFCGAELTVTFADLGMSPPSNSYLTREQLSKKEAVYPLHAWVCGECKLVQLEEFETPAQIFSDYAYFSAYSESWLKHAENYVEMMRRRFGIGAGASVVEIASNDGYLLQYFKRAGANVLGIEPAGNVAKVAREERGIQTRVEFFGEACARKLKAEGVKPVLMLGNNVLAHVPDINDFVEGMKVLLSEEGIFTMEFPHLLRLIEENQFDTIYHEHFSYLSFSFAQRLFAAHGLKLFDVEELPTHGGSIRIFGAHAESAREIGPRVGEMLEMERRHGLGEISTYQKFEKRIQKTREAFLRFLNRAKAEGKKIVGYGAAAKGNTLLNFCGVRGDSIEYVVDRSPHKQGKFLPGSHIPIEAPEKVRETKPDYLLILPWNIRGEVMGQMDFIREWGGKFVVAIPVVRDF